MAEEKSDLTKTWKLASLALIVLLAISIFFNINSNLNSSGIAGMVISQEDAAEKAVIYINNLGVNANLVGVNESKGLYAFDMRIDGRPYMVYMTKDGSLMFPQVLVLTGEVQEEPQQLQQNIPKSDKPNVELFIMSHCPFGTQMEKGILPVVELLGDKVDFNVRFVYYAMHGGLEVNEQTKQYCIQKEQNDKFLDYLSCFLEEGDTADCLVRTGIDTTKLDSCVEQADEEFDISKNLEDQSSWLSGQYPLFNINKDLNEQYGVRGSPLLVINGEEVSSGRDSASLLSAVCSGFNEQPSECNTQLSSTPPSSGFGYEGTGSDTGSCS